MWRPVVVAVGWCCAAVLLSPVTPTRAAEPAPDRATWVWGRPGAAVITTFATEHGVDDLFVHVPTPISATDRSWLTDLRARTTAAGIGLHALGSEPSWLAKPSAALAWQAEVVATGFFDGIHLDVEPWAQVGWGQRKKQATLINQYVTLLDRLEGATGLPVEADIPFWFGEHTHARRPLDVVVMETVDAVTVLTYRNTVSGPDSITSLGERALTVGAQTSTPVRLAVETNYLGADAVSLKQTFFGRTATELDSALAAVDAAEAHAPAYRGMSVHDVTGWSALAP